MDNFFSQPTLLSDQNGPVSFDSCGSLAAFHAPLTCNQVPNPNPKLHAESAQFTRIAGRPTKQPTNQKKTNKNYEICRLTKSLENDIN